LRKVLLRFAPFRSAIIQSSRKQQQEISFFPQQYTHILLAAKHQYHGMLPRIYTSSDVGKTFPEF
jgi:hypothetical protein